MSFCARREAALSLFALSVRFGRSFSFKGFENPMHTPSRWIFILSLLVALVALASHFMTIPVVSPNAVFVALVSWLVLTIGCFVKTT
jgi:hypothetical protein